MAYIVSLKQFDGPLDLLLTLIGDAKLDISEISISQVTGQYLATMSLAEELDMDSASEFLQMAATLLEIKSRRMLPKPPPPEEEGALTPEQLLIKQLEEYKQFKELTEKLRKYEAEAQALITKLPEEFPLPPPEIEITNVTMDRLLLAFRRVMERVERRSDDARASHEVRHDAYTVAGCMVVIQRALKKGERSFFRLTENAVTKEEVVCMFMAMLELVKIGKIRINQQVKDEDIRIEPA